MSNKGDINLLKYAMNAAKDARKYICERSFAVFAMYYFAEFFVYVIPDFHWKMYKELDGFTTGKKKYLLWVMFRESAKTSIAKMYVIYCICYQKKRFINYDSYDKGNAEQALFDIVTWLQQNHRIIKDFDHLFIEDAKHSARFAKLKRVGEFITANKVKVKAYSTQESTRGRIFGRYRPDLYIVDDFETEVTCKSVVNTAKVIAHIDTMKTGMAVDGQVIFLCNFISDSGSVASLVQESKENPDIWCMHRVDVEGNNEKGNRMIAWPEKYVWTNEEAAELNSSIEDRSEHRVSLEQKRKDLNASGRKVYEAEMLNDPEASGDLFFNRERVTRDIDKAKHTKPLKDVGGLSVWEEFRAKNRYAFGGDTSKGVKRDSCTSVGIRFSKIDKEPAKVVATYESNTISPDLFGDEMAAHGNLYGKCLLVPELNNTGYATVTKLKAVYPEHRIYKQVKEDESGKKITKNLGWEATSSNVAALYYNFRSSYEEGAIEIFCPILLAEMRLFTKGHLEGAIKKGEQVDGAGIVTKHFDMLRAAVICWEMRAHAPEIKEKKSYKQERRQSISEYQE